VLCILVVLSLHANFARPQSLPGYHRVQRPMTVPLDPPVAFAKKSADSSQVQQDAEDLARLSAAIPAQIKNVNQKLPKDLNDQLRRIEKLAKRIRSEISQ
jgi:small-conductance mechanosensitive channel